MSLLEMAKQNWPKDRPFPTPEQMERARKLYEEDMRKNDPEMKDQTDWPVGLEFVMAAYNGILWMRFFE